MAARDTRSSARRRRERRLPATVAMALVAATHHSAQRGEWRDLYEAPRGQDRQCRGHVRCSTEPDDERARDNEFFSLYEEELGGTRRSSRSGRKTGLSGALEQIVDNTLIVPTLDVPAPQMENPAGGGMPAARCPHSRAGYRSAQDLLFPSFSQAPCAFRGAVGGTVGGSADDRTLLFVARACGAERGHSVRHGRDRVGGGFLGLHPGQSSTAFGGAQYFPAATAEQIVDIPVPRGGRVLHPASSSSGLLGTANQWFFRTFIFGKKVRSWVCTRGRNWVRTLLHPRQRLSWRVSSRMQLVCGCCSQMDGGNFWARIQKFGVLGDGWDGALVMRQLSDAIESISCPSCSCCSHFESGALFPWPCIWQSLLRASGCCL